MTKASVLPTSSLRYCQLLWFTQQGSRLDTGSTYNLRNSMGYLVPDNFTWKSLKQGIVIINLREGTYYTLNEQASIIWKGLMDDLATDEIVASLVDEFDCTPEQAEGDVLEYIKSCIAEGVLVVKNNNQNP